MNAPLLAVNNIGCRFGGFVALEGVTTTFLPGKVTSIIGPNGAGKSTFFNLLSGVLTPSSGLIRFKGKDLSGTPQHQFVHLGIARSYQITNIFPDLSVHENVRVAAQATAGAVRATISGPTETVFPNSVQRPTPHSSRLG